LAGVLLVDFAPATAARGLAVGSCAKASPLTALTSLDEEARPCRTPFFCGRSEASIGG